MSGQRWFALSLLLVGAACARPTDTQAPKPLKPTDGPNGSIRVSYSGGLLYRNVEAWFRVNQNSFVMVGHLGGDGMIRIIYPDYPTHNPIVGANRSVRTQTFNANYDGAPSYYTFATVPWRSMSAVQDSYDGLGHGYVFMILSRYPLDAEAVSDGEDWAPIPVRDYNRLLDPREAIRIFADRVSEGRPYTLKFATSFTTQAYSQYATRMADCMYLGSIGYIGSFWSAWNITRDWYYGSWYDGIGAGGYCGRSYASYALGYVAYPGYIQRLHPFTPASPVTPRTPVSPPATPTLSRPTFRTLTDRSHGMNAARSALDRARATPNVQVGSRAFAPFSDPIIDRPSGHSYRPPSSYEPPRSWSGGGSSSSGGTRAAPSASASTPTASAPRPSAPASAPAPSTSSSSSGSSGSTAKKHQ